MLYAKLPPKTGINNPNTTQNRIKKAYPTSANPSPTPEFLKTLHPQTEGSEHLHQSVNLYIHSSLVSKF